MADTVVPVTDNVNGNITDCKIETVQKSVDRKGAFSMTQKEHYMTYDVCTKKVISEYATSSIAGGGVLIIMLGVIVFGIIIAGISAVVSEL